MCLSLAALAAVCLAGQAVVENKQVPHAQLSNNVTEEINLITKSLDGMLDELAIIKREATGRLTKVRTSTALLNGDSQAERIHQTKVSKFVLSRIAELERESLGMRDVLTKMLVGASGHKASVAMRFQEDHDFEESPTAAPSTTTTGGASASPASTTAAIGSTTPTGMPATSTAAIEEEGAKIGFDLEALKRLGEEIGKRLDQFGKDTSKNLGELLEGIKLVFREPNRGGNKSTTSTPIRGLRQL